MVNENNYVGANITVVGTAGGPWQIRDLGQSGFKQAELSIAVSKGYKDKNNNNEWVDQGTDWYTLTATPQYAEDNWPEVGAGDKVRVDEAKLTLRPYTKKDGEPGVDAKLQFGYLSVVSKKQAAQENAFANGF